MDFGCGTGLLSQRMSPLARNIVALDLSEAMIEELDRKEPRNVEPVVDCLTRGLVAQHPAFRKQFELVVAASLCACLPNLQDVTDIIFKLVDEGGYFVHFDWLADGKSEIGLSTTEIESVLRNAGSLPWRLGSRLMSPPHKAHNLLWLELLVSNSSIHRVRYSRNLYSGFIFAFAIPFLLEAAGVLATFVHPNHIVNLCSWGLSHLPPICNSKLFGDKSYRHCFIHCVIA